MKSNSGSISSMGRGGELTEKEVWALRERVQRARGAGNVYVVDAAVVERFRMVRRGAVVPAEAVPAEAVLADGVLAEAVLADGVLADGVLADGVDWRMVRDGLLAGKTLVQMAHGLGMFERLNGNGG